VVTVEGRDVSAQLHRAQAAETEAHSALEEADGAIRAADAALRTSESNRDLAEATRKRYDLLRQRRSISAQEFDEVDTRSKSAVSEAQRAQESLTAARARRMQVLARIEQAEAEVEAARIAVGYLNIAAPISGVVTGKKADVGMVASPGMPLLTIDDDKTYQLETVVEESRAAGITAGLKTSAVFDALGATLPAQVSEVVPAVDPATRTYTVKLDFAVPSEARGRLHSGLFGRALFPVGVRQALLIPESALVHRGQLAGVYTIIDDVASLRLIKTGKHYGGKVEVLSGLTAGNRFISAPPEGISDGAKIVEAEGIKP
jgi:multidrug efflux system membrane fusion protein